MIHLKDRINNICVFSHFPLKGALLSMNILKILLETLAILSQSQNPMSRKLLKTIILGWTSLPWK